MALWKCSNFGKFWKILTRKCWRQQNFCWKNIICKYFWKLDIKSVLRAKFQVSSTFGSNLNLGGQKINMHKIISSVLRTVPVYSNISTTCLWSLAKELCIATYHDQEELLNKRSRKMSKCRHENKCLLANDQLSMVQFLHTICFRNV